MYAFIVFPAAGILSMRHARRGGSETVDVRGVRGSARRREAFKARPSGVSSRDAAASRGPRALHKPGLHGAQLASVPVRRRLREETAEVEVRGRAAFRARPQERHAEVQSVRARPADVFWTARECSDQRGGTPERGGVSSLKTKSMIPLRRHSISAATGRQHLDRLPSLELQLN